MTRLNRAVVDGFKVPPGKESVIAWDSALPGFGVRINAGGTRSYVTQYRNGSGVTNRISLGRYEAMSIDDARKLARSTLVKATTGSDPAEERAKARAAASLTVGSVADAYLKAVASRLKARSHQEVSRHLTKHWDPLRATPVHQIKRADVAAVLRDIAGTRGSSPRIGRAPRSRRCSPGDSAKGWLRQTPSSARINPQMSARETTCSRMQSCKPSGAPVATIITAESSGCSSSLASGAMKSGA
jgi:hypothetical protein